MRNACLILAVVLVVGLAGCGDGRPKVVPASGQVLINGKPLTVEGFVRVEPGDGHAAIGKIDPKTGNFTLTTFEEGDGCITGEHPVAVIANVPRGSELISLIPEQYADASTSNLKVKIDESTDSLKIELTGQLKKAPAPSPEIYKGDKPGL